MVVMELAVIIERILRSLWLDSEWEAAFDKNWLSTTRLRAVLIISLGCEKFARGQISRMIAKCTDRAVTCAFAVAEILELSSQTP